MQTTVDFSATFSRRYGKFVNDSATNANCVVKPIYDDRTLHLCLIALKDIEKGVELRYNYGVGGLTFRKVCITFYFAL